MKNRGGILALFVIFLLISFYYLGRTWKVNDIRKDAVTYATGKDGKINPSKKQGFLDSLWKTPALPSILGGSTLEDLSKQELGLGLDLQGGMHVILEVSSGDVIKALAGKTRDPKVNIAIENAKKAAMNSNTNFTDIFVNEFKKIAPTTNLRDVFLNKNNRELISSTSSDSQVTNYLKSEVEDAYKRSYNVIQNRVDKFGVSNVNLSKITGTNRIQIELPGIDNPERVRKLLTGVAKLQFCEVVMPQEIAGSFNKFSELLNKIDQETKAVSKVPGTKPTSDLATALQSKSDTLKKDSLNANSLSNIFIQSQSGGLAIKSKDTSRLNQILKRPDAAGIFPPDISFVYNFKADENLQNTTKSTADIITVYLVKDLGNAPLEGDVITSAYKDSDQFGKRAISMAMNVIGSRKWAELTKKVSLNQYSKQIAIVLDNYVYSAPSVKEEITGGRSIISGSFSPDEQDDLENVLKAGKLPAPTNIIEEAVVGATVGSNALSAGILSSIIGLIAVLIFVMVYYNQAGWIANAALLINLVLLLGVMASFGATMTLPGIAGLVLSVGMSVDANVLIFERIKEEMIAGKGFVASITDGFKHAMPSIIDSNVATLITGVILFIFGTGLVKGFATTLLIGIFTSLFCAVFVARLMFEYFIKRGKTINFKTAWTERLFKDSNIDFIQKRKTFYMISAAIVLAGIVSIGIRGFGLGVDFKGGRTYEAKFEKTVNTESIRKTVEGVFPNTNVEVKTYGGFDKVKITSSYLIENTDVEVEKQIKEKLDKTLSAIAGNKGTVVASSKVGPTIANDTIWSSLKAILYSLIFVFIYIYIRFRSLAFGFGAVVALFHDVLVILGIFSILNGFLPFSLDIDQAFVGAVLTLMGYSMNDTVVVFDRIREYLSEKGAKKEPMATTINNALNSTLSRTAVTGVATLLVLFILLIFGGETIRGFVFCMFIGVIVGTYSSLFIASPIVVDAMQRRLESEGDAIRASTSSAAKA
jgi:SecD/SecF fusion protein